VRSLQASSALDMAVAMMETRACTRGNYSAELSFCLVEVSCRRIAAPGLSKKGILYCIHACSRIQDEHDLTESGLTTKRVDA